MDKNIEMMAYVSYTNKTPGKEDMTFYNPSEIDVRKTAEYLYISLFSQNETEISMKLSFKNKAKHTENQH